MRDFFHKYDPVFFEFPIDGDCLNAKDAVERDGVLYIKPIVKAADNAEITVNGVAADYDADAHTYTAEIALRHFRNTVVAIDKKNGYRAEIVVYKLHDAVGKYFFTVDDCILTLADLTAHPESYPSMFDHPFLATLKEAHDRYGAPVHLNLFYSFDEAAATRFSAHKTPFDLSMMTDRYRPEFEANADWLSLSYHAHADLPDMPMKNQSPEFLTDSIEKTHREILRFAGARSLSPATTLHWGNGPIEALRVFRECGYRILLGSFRAIHPDEAYVSYYGRDGLPAYLRGTGKDSYDQTTVDGAGYPGRDVFKDNREDMIYCHTDMVLNLPSIKTEEIGAWIDEYVAAHPTLGIMSLMIHEQYCFPDFCRAIPDTAERILSAIRHLYDKGYRGVAIEEVCLEKGLAH